MEDERKKERKKRVRQGGNEEKRLKINHCKKK